MTLYAFDRIEIGTANKEDPTLPGKRTVFEAGDEIKGLSAELTEQLVANGAISKYNRLEVEAAGLKAVATGADSGAAVLSEENAELKERIAELEAAAASAADTEKAAKATETK